MEGLGLFIAFCLFITFGPPVLLFILGASDRKNKQRSKVFYILGTIWLVVGGGICASLLAG